MSEPSAFPIITLPEHCVDQEGMTLRDWFAGQALIGILAQPHNNWNWYDQDTIPNIANKAHRIADEMMKRRNP